MMRHESEHNRMKRNERKLKRGLLLLLVVCSQVWIVGLQAQVRTPDRTQPPPLGPPPALTLPTIRHLTLANGLPVILLERHEVPLVQVTLVINTGGTDNALAKSGLASITAAMLTEGAGRRDALQLADAIDYLGARLSASAGLHTTAVSLHTPLAELDSALALMADVAERPTFPAAELERERKERLTSLVQWHDEPRAIASVEFNRSLYGNDHPYGIPIIGMEKSLRSFSTEDLHRYYESCFGANNATLVVVGDVTADDVRPKLESSFGTWKPVAPAKVNLPAIEQVSGRHIVLVDKPGAAQSEIRIGRIGVPRLTDDYFAIVVMNTILGGSFTSRLNQNLREEHGYTYGAGSRFDFRPLPGPFIASAAVQTAVTDKALMEFMKELNAIRRPVPDSELVRAKNYVALSFPADFQSVAQIAGELEQLVIYHLPDDYFNSYIGRILAVTTADVERVAKKYIDPENLDIIIVGDRKQIEAGVRALNLGTVTTMTVDEVLGKAPAVGEGK